MVGQIAARAAANSGVKNVERPLDFETAFTELKAHDGNPA